MTTVSMERLAQIFVEAADTLVDEFDLLDFLHTLADRSADLVVASAVGLTLADERGRLEFMAASSEDARLIDLFRSQTRQGPAVDAFRTGAPVTNVDLAGAGARWPQFAPAAVAAGFRTVHAFPLRLRSRRIGALIVLDAIAGGNVEESDERIMQALADVAAIGLLQERTVQRGELLTEQLQGALNSRIVIEQAKGAVAQARGVGVDEAFTVIRDVARLTGRNLTDVAREIVASSGHAPQLP